MQPKPLHKEIEHVIALERWLREFKEVDEQEAPEDRMSNKYRMVALKTLLGEGTRIREHVTIKEAEGTVKSFEDMLSVVRQWAETKRMEKLRGSDDMDCSPLEPGPDTTLEEEDWRCEWDIYNMGWSGRGWKGNAGWKGKGKGK